MKQLSEKNFIRNEGPKGPSLLPFFTSLLLLIFVFLILAELTRTYQNYWKQTEISKPFLDVSNREMSLFLWQFPGFMRVYAKQKTAYLPGFRYVETQTVDPSQADSIVVAPPQILFLYHTWKRLLSFYYIPRPIPREEFIEFLQNDAQWQPEYWLEAPYEYRKWLEKGLVEESTDDLSNLSMQQLPLVVRQAFQGWKNYYKEGDAINRVAPTYDEMKRFLSIYPNYYRNYWVNIKEIEGVPITGLDYLLSLFEMNGGEKKITEDQLSGFLKVAYYNFEHRLL